MRTGSGVTCRRGDAELLQMAPPRRLVGKLPLPVRGQLPDHRSGQGVLTHVVQRRLVDDVVGVTGAQQVEEVQPALAAGRAEPGELSLPICVHTALAPRWRAPVSSTVIQPHVCSPARSTSRIFRQEVVLPVDQQAHHLPLGDADPDRLQQPDQPLDRHLPLVILHQHEAAQLRPEMAADAPGSGATMVSPAGVSQRSRR